MRAVDRITPACAGNSLTSKIWRSTRWDHPRLRGEQRCLGNAVVPQQGSPPLARGTEHSATWRGGLTGITPACAGNRRPSAARAQTAGDHPRLRGEQAILVAVKVYVQGSPPLARGTERGRHGLLARRGITPACAGNSPSSRYSAHKAGDHPRLRGEQNADGTDYWPGGGSPPLARGTAALQVAAVFRCGITPACAGNRLRATIRRR